MADSHLPHRAARVQRIDAATTRRVQSRRAFAGAPPTPAEELRQRGDRPGGRGHRISGQPRHRVDWRSPAGHPPARSQVPRDSPVAPPMEQASLTLHGSTSGRVERVPVRVVQDTAALRQCDNATAARGHRPYAPRASSRYRHNSQRARRSRACAPVGSDDGSNEKPRMRGAIRGRSRADQFSLRRRVTAAPSRPIPRSASVAGSGASRRIAKPAGSPPTPLPLIVRL
jgi:hypothetical protein